MSDCDVSQMDGLMSQPMPGCDTCKHIANDGKHPCNTCGDGDYINYEKED